VVQALAFERANPAFGEGVCLRRGMHPARPRWAQPFASRIRFIPAMAGSSP
jgi:hypothetical protein